MGGRYITNPPPASPIDRIIGGAALPSGMMKRRVLQVPLHASSLGQRSCYIMDEGSCLRLWHGPLASPTEKLCSLKVLRRALPPWFVSRR